jgi:glycosyltransferase involved in cell wall biosynthesis
MIWLASFPRSGNTFFRNILFEVYGLESSTFHQENYPVDPNYDQFQVVKTHLLPHQLLPADPNIKSVYLVRDGRDCMVSLAHQRSDIIAPGSDFLENMEAAIHAAGGSFFGGWGENVSQWIERADIIIRYEDLVKDPIGQAERLRAILDLPEPMIDKVPTFEKLKFGTPKYGSKQHILKDETEQKEFSGKFFRKGKSGGWREEMPAQLHELFWRKYGPLMEKMGYGLHDEDRNICAELHWELAKKLNQAHDPRLSEEKVKVLIEATKLLDFYTDGVKRYLLSLISELKAISTNPYWQVDLHVAGKIVPISAFSPELFQEEDDRHPSQKSPAMLAKKMVKNILPRKSYNHLAQLYRKAKYRVHLKASGWRRSLHTEDKDPFSCYDLIHVPLFQNFTPFEKTESRFLFTVHDFTHRLFPEFHTERNIHLAEAGWQFSLKKKAHYLAISDATAADLIAQCKECEERTFVVKEAAELALFQKNSNLHLAALVREKYGIGEGPFFLCLSTIEPRKNLLRTARAFRTFKQSNPESPLKLAIAGNKGWKHQELFAQEDIHHADILFTGYVDEGHLSVLYSEAWALVYCSLYEGFGLPVLEALSCGTPVIAGNNSSLPEVVGEAGILCQADDVSSIAEALQKMSDEKTRESLAQKAIAQAFQFTWHKTATETLNLYRTVLGV